ISLDEVKEFFSEKEFKDFETLVSNKEKLRGTKINPELNLKKDFIEKLTISKSSPLNFEIKKIDIKKLDSDQTFENQFSDLLDDFDSGEEENQYVDLDKSKSIREQLIRKNEISQNLIQRFSEFLGSRIINQINAGRWETNIVLRPERLGKLNVKINLDNGEFKANFSTSNSVSRDILIEAIPKLKFNLENSGMNVASVNVDVFSSSDKNQGNQKNYILNQELNRTDRTDSEDEVMDTVSVQKINFSVDGIDIVI
ncbi:MAG: flagellar hook-length control protein FliK, partial [Hydrogenophilales bacterium]